MKKILSVVAAALLAFTLVGCNRQVIDTTYKYTYAYVELPDGTCVKGEVKKWKDFEDGDQLQVTIGDKTYLSNSSRIVLVAE